MALAIWHAAFGLMFRDTTSLVVQIEESKAVFSYFKISKILQDFPSHQIFGRMYGVLNIGKKNN
jgi:hypothetical protein